MTSVNTDRLDSEPTVIISPSVITMSPAEIADLLTGVSIERDRLRTLCFNIYQAVHDEGDRPNWHRRIMEKHRQQWETLWAAIDDLLNDDLVKEYSDDE